MRDMNYKLIFTNLILNPSQTLPVQINPNPITPKSYRQLTSVNLSVPKIAKYVSTSKHNYAMHVLMLASYRLKRTTASFLIREETNLNWIHQSLEAIRIYRLQFFFLKEQGIPYCFFDKEKAFLARPRKFK